VTTDSTGAYTFESLAAGTYYVRQNPIAGYRKTVPGSGISSYDVIVTGGEVITNKNFGNTRNILIAGTVYNDINSNGTKDAGETGIAGVAIKIVSNNQIIATRTTDASGIWQIKGLSGGSGEAVLAVPLGRSPTNPSSGKYTGSMTSGQQNANLNFGLHISPPLIPSPTPAFSTLVRYQFGTILLINHGSLLEQDGIWLSVG
jgi:hypothetical protein